MKLKLHEIEQLGGCPRLHNICHGKDGMMLLYYYTEVENYLKKNKRRFCKCPKDCYKKKPCLKIGNDVWKFNTCKNLKISHNIFRFFEIENKLEKI